MTTDLIHELNTDAVAVSRSLGEVAILQRLLDGSIGRKEYVLFLTQSFHYVRWTAPLLARSGERLRTLGGSESMSDLLAQKAHEESGHERWLLADLASLAVGETATLASEPSPAIAAYVAWNRFEAEVGSPLAILGTAFILEHLAAQGAGDVARRIEQSGRIANIHRATRFLRGHGASDVGHLAELSRALREISDPEQREAIRLSARTTRALYGRFFTARPPFPHPDPNLPGEQDNRAALGY